MQNKSYFIFIVATHPNFATKSQSSASRAKKQIYLDFSETQPTFDLYQRSKIGKNSETEKK